MLLISRSVYETLYHASNGIEPTSYNIEELMLLMFIRASQCVSDEVGSLDKTRCATIDE